MAVNMAPQGMLPLPVQQVAAAQHLGAFIRTYKATLTGTIGGSITFLVGAAFFCAGGIFPPDLTGVTRVILLIFGLSFLGLAISLAYSVIQVANQQIHLFQRGIVIHKGDQVQAFPWRQAAEVWQSITRSYRNGRHVGTTYIYTLRRVDGYEIKLNNLTQDIAELGPAVAQGITQELVPRALYALRTGQTLTFAPFSVSRQGIGNGREIIPWSQVQAVNVNQGRVTIKKAGMSRNWGMAAVAKVPNFFVFTVVTEEMRRQK